eukprot:347890-Chlamydomonas_euryale.AAC.1
MADPNGLRCHCCLLTWRPCTRAKCVNAHRKTSGECARCVGQHVGGGWGGEHVKCQAHWSAQKAKGVRIERGLPGAVVVTMAEGVAELERCWQIWMRDVSACAVLDVGVLGDFQALLAVCGADPHGVSSWAAV